MTNLALSITSLPAKDASMAKCTIDHSDPDGIPKDLCRKCHPELNTTREQWHAKKLAYEKAHPMVRKDPPMATKSPAQLKEKLAELNALRMSRGIDPIKHWRASFEGLVEAIEECKKRIADNIKVSTNGKPIPPVTTAFNGKPKKGRKAATVPDASNVPAKVAKAPPVAKVAAKPGTVEAFNEALNIRGDSIRGKLTTLLFNNMGKEVKSADLMKAAGINASGLKGALKYIVWRMGEKKIKNKLVESGKGAKLTK
jgi:hypothetical protein